MVLFFLINKLSLPLCNEKSIDRCIDVYYIPLQITLRKCLLINLFRLNLFSINKNGKNTVRLEL